MKKENHRFCFCFIILNFLFNAQAQNVSWARGFGNSANEEVIASKVDQNKNVYLAGTFRNSVDFDPGPGTLSLTSAGWEDAYLCKLDSGGSFLWAIRIGGADNDNIISISIDKSNNVYVCGLFFGLVDFDPGPGTYTIDIGTTF